MKRISAIIQSVILSMLVIALGGGIALVNCYHTGDTEIVSVIGSSHNMSLDEGTSSDCCKKDCDNARPMSDCMSVKVLKLAPSNVAQHFSYHFIDVPHTLPYPAAWVDLLSLPVAVKTVCKYIGREYISPPRGYLRLLRVLII